MKKAQIELFWSQNENRRLEQVYKKLWNVFGLLLLEVEAANRHDGHLSSLNSDSLLRLQRLCIFHRSTPLGIIS